jgi:hypothetical protein
MDASILGIDIDLIDPKTSQEAIIKACVKKWFEQGPNGLPNSGDCNGFVKSVQTELSLRPFKGGANEIFDEVESRPDWQVLGFGKDGIRAAGNAANQGFLTVAVWKNPIPGKHGHVAIITSYLAFLGVKPEQKAIGAWGQLHGVGSVMDKMSQSFGADKHKNNEVKYAKCLTKPFC